MASKEGDSGAVPERKYTASEITIFAIFAFGALVWSAVFLFHIITGVWLFNSKKAELLENNVGSFVRYSFPELGGGVSERRGTLGGFAIVSFQGRLMAKVSLIKISEDGMTANTVRTFYVDAWDLGHFEVLEPMFERRD